MIKEATRGLAQTSGHGRKVAGGRAIVN
jgi:hypothetical protein